jgi:hypothetical protein
VTPDRLDSAGGAVVRVGTLGTYFSDRL